MADFPRFVDEYAVVGTHAGVDHADVGCYEGDLGRGVGVDEGCGGLLFGGEDDAVGGFDAQAGHALVYCVQGILCTALVSDMAHVILYSRRTYLYQLAATKMSASIQLYT